MVERSLAVYSNQRGDSIDQHHLKIAILSKAILGLLSLSGVVAADTTAVSQPEDWDRRLEMLRSMPYLGYTEETVQESVSGVVLHDPERAFTGYNFYCTQATGEIFLLDMYGQEIHRWTYSPERRSGSDHAVMLPDGDLIIIHEYIELFRIDWNSEVIWQKRLRAHHDAALAPDGTFYVILRELREHRGLKVWFDVLAHLTARGEELGRWSAFDHLLELQTTLDPRSFLDTILDNAPDSSGEKKRVLPREKARVTPGARNLDYFHMNAVGMLPATALGEQDSRFAEGNLLVCFRNVNQIALLEKGTHRILWSWGEGELEWPHHPTMLQNGHILIFDNGVRRGYSRVVELDPIEKRIVWEFKADPPEQFYSYGRGSAQRLGNGNTLICESDGGRAFEVTDQGEMVWIWLNPIIKRDRRGTVYRMLRWPPDDVERILAR